MKRYFILTIVILIAMVGNSLNSYAAVDADALADYTLLGSGSVRIYNSGGIFCSDPGAAYHYAGIGVALFDNDDNQIDMNGEQEWESGGYYSIEGIQKEIDSLQSGLVCYVYAVTIIRTYDSSYQVRYDILEEDNSSTFTIL